MLMYQRMKQLKILLSLARPNFASKLQAVHSGEDLSAAIDTVLGYRQESVKGKAIDVPPLPGASQKLRQLLRELRETATEESAGTEALESHKTHPRVAPQVKLCGYQSCLPIAVQGCLFCLGGVSHSFRLRQHAWAHSNLFKSSKSALCF